MHRQQVSVLLAQFLHLMFLMGKLIFCFEVLHVLRMVCAAVIAAQKCRSAAWRWRRQAGCILETHSALWLLVCTGMASMANMMNPQMMESAMKMFQQMDEGSLKQVRKDAHGKVLRSLRLTLQQSCQVCTGSD